MHHADQVGLALHLYAHRSRLEHTQCCCTHVATIFDRGATAIYQRQTHRAAAAFNKVSDRLRVAARPCGERQLGKYGNLPRKRNTALHQIALDVLRMAREQQRAGTEHGQQQRCQRG